MRIGELAKRSDISTDTVRFYEKEGLIRSDRRSNGYRDYADEMLFVVQFIRTAQGLGFTLAEIRKDIPALMSGELPEERVREILAGKIAAINQRIDGLSVLRDQLEKHMEQVCPIRLQCEAVVERFNGEESASRKSV